MNETETLKSVSDTLLSAPVKLEIDVVHRNWINKLLIKWKWKEPKRIFELTPITLGSLVKISKELLDIDLSEFDNANLLESNYKLIDRHSNRLARVVAIAVVNSRNDPPKSLVDFFLHNLTAAELFKVASIVLKQMDVQSFMLSIISIKGTNVLQTGTSLQPRETIAFGKQSEE